jgi:hypothetical protein
VRLETGRWRLRCGRDTPSHFCVDSIPEPEDSQPESGGRQKVSRIERYNRIILALENGNLIPIRIPFKPCLFSNAGILF